MENKIQMRKDLADMRATVADLERDLRNTRKGHQFAQLREAIRAVMPNKATTQFWSPGPTIFVKQLEAILERFREKDSET